MASTTFYFLSILVVILGLAFVPISFAQPQTTNVDVCLQEFPKSNSFKNFEITYYCNYGGDNEYFTGTGQITLKPPACSQALLTCFAKNQQDKGSPPLVMIRGVANFSMSEKEYECDFKINLTSSTQAGLKLMISPGQQDGVTCQVVTD